MMKPLPWFELQPEWYQEEIDSLTQLGIDYVPNEKLKSQGILFLSLNIQPDNPNFSKLNLKNELKLTAQYPDTFPYFRPEVIAPDLNLPRHQHPVTKNLCLLPRNTFAWNPTQTLGSFLAEQLPKVFVKGYETDLDKIKADPLEQAEPASEYYVSLGAPHVLFNNMPYKLEKLGPGVSLVDKVILGVPKNPATLHFEVLGRPNEITPTQRSQYFKSPSVEIFFVTKLPELGNNNKDLWDSIVKDLNTMRLKPASDSFPLPSGHMVKSIFGVCFPEERSKGEESLGLLFFSHIHLRSGTTTKHEYFIHKVESTRAEELQQRIPTLTSLRNKTITVIGLGALGAPSVIEFAKAGVKKIHVLDYDTVDIGPTVRWPLGKSAVGMFKTSAIKDFLREHYPQVEIEVYQKRIGLVRNPESDTVNELHLLERLTKNSSLIYDAAVEHGVHHILSILTTKHSIPYVIVSATPGVWGGTVVSFEPEKTKGCYMCYVEAKGDNTIPAPPSDPAGNLQALGCGDLSFTGTGFDLMNIIAAGVRVSVGLLCKDDPSGYELVGKDVRILSLRGKNNEPILPEWFTQELQVHHACISCNS